MSGAMAVEAEAGSSDPPSPTRDEEGGHTRRRGGWTAWLVRGGKKRVKLPVSASPGEKERKVPSIEPSRRMRARHHPGAWGGCERTGRSCA